MQLHDGFRIEVSPSTELPSEVCPWNFLQHAEEGKVSVLAAYRGDVLAGAAVFEHRISHTLLRYIFVKDEYRGQGAGRALIELAASASLPDGSKKPLIADLSYTGYEAAEPFLSACGFSLLRELPCIIFPLEALARYVENIPDDIEWRQLSEVPPELVYEFIMPIPPENLLPLTPDEFFVPSASPASSVLLRGGKICAIAIFEECRDEVRLIWYYALAPEDTVLLLGVCARLFAGEYDDKYKMSFAGYSEALTDFLCSIAGIPTSSVNTPQNRRQILIYPASDFHI